MYNLQNDLMICFCISVLYLVYILLQDVLGISKVGISKVVISKSVVWERSIGFVGSKVSLMKFVKSNKKKGSVSIEKLEALIVKLDISEKKKNFMG